jgi:hypothetical protein
MFYNPSSSFAITAVWGQLILCLLKDDGSGRGETTALALKLPPSKILFRNEFNLNH